MGKTLGYGEITVANMTEPFTVMLTNEAQQFATDSNRKVTSAQSYYTDIIVIRGSQERTDYTIGNITSGSGITVSKTNERVTFSVSVGATIGADTGVIEIPITLDGQTVKKQFSWSCGKQGPQGVKGDPGTSVKITSKSVTYQTSTSGTTAPTGTWSTTVPTVNNGQYLWTKTTVQYSDGNKTEAYSVSYKGTNGTNGTSVTVSKTEVTYQVSTSGTTAPTGTWSTTMPSCDQGQYLWTKTYVKYSDGKETTSYSVSYKGVDGEKFAFNMLRETNQGSKHWGNHASGGKYSVESTTTEDGINAVKIITTEAIPSNGWHYVTFADYKMLKSLTPSTTYTLSFDIWSNQGNHYEWITIQQGSATNAMTSSSFVQIKGNENWQHTTTTLTTVASMPEIASQCIYMTGTSAIGYAIIKNLKLTEGAVDTPWAPHPEDLEGRGVSQTVQYYLATSQASGVTSSTSGWSTDITTQKLTADKKYLWNCYQTKYSDGTSEPISTPKVIGVYGDKGQKGDSGEDGQDGAGFHWNLLSGTKDFDKTKMSIAGATSFDSQKYLGLTVIKAVSPTSGYIDPVAWNSTITPTPNTQYTISFYAKASVKTLANSYFYPNCTIKCISNHQTTNTPDGAVSTMLSTEWERYSVTWTTSGSVSGTKSIIPVRLQHGISVDGATVYLCGVKLEQSDKPSPWCTTYEETLAKNLSITPSSQYFKSTDGGKTFAPNTITIKPTIQGEINFGKWQYSIDGGVSFADVVNGQKGLTISNNVLTVSRDSSLYSDAVTMVTFRAVASDSSFYDTCSIAKIYDVSDIGDGRNLLTGVSSYTKDAPFEKTDSRADGWIVYQNIITSIELEAGKKYVLQAKTDGNWTANHDTNGQDPSKKLVTLWLCSDTTNDFFDMRQGYVVFTPTVTAKYKLRVNQYSNGTDDYTIRLWDIKLEKGSSPTGWTPAPEDVQTAILSTKSEISDVSLKVDKNKQAIEQRVEKTTYQQDLNLVNGDISKANEGLNKWRYEIYPKSLFTSEYQGKSTIDVFAKNTNLTPSQSVLINDTDLSVAWNYAENYIGYALTFAKFSAAKSVAITFAHDDGAHIYLNGKLIGGSDAYNKNGESLTLGFVKGWNCIEVVVNEGANTEGFKLGTTISAISECQLMNCYYGTPVARQSHITNQLVENTTNIKGISTKVSKVTSVIGDNGENFTSFKNEYSDFKQTMNGFKNTVGQTYVTKNDFNGLEIGGRNLLWNSGTTTAIQNSGEWNAHGCTATAETRNNCLVSRVNSPWNGYQFNLKKIIERYNLVDGDILTYSIDVKMDEPIDILFVNNYYADNKGCTGGISTVNLWDGKYFTIGKWERLSFTFKITQDTLDKIATDTYRQGVRTAFEPAKATSEGKYVYFACPKLERGTKATDYTPAPEDDEINGQNLVSNLPSNWEQGTFDGNRVDVGGVYNTGKVDNSTRIRVKELVPVSGTITISNAYSNQSKKPIQHVIAAFDVNKKYLGSGYINTDWNDFPRIVDMKDAKYIAVIVKYKDNSAIIPSDISQICLKIERGTSATPFTLAPEDVNGKIVNVETIANQTAKKFEWIVKGESTSSNLALTDNALTAIANNINLTGKVTFNSFDQSLKDTINNKTNVSYLSLSSGGNNQACWKIATIKISGNYTNQDIIIGVNHRGHGYTECRIQFKNAGNPDPGLASFRQTGLPSKCWRIIKTANSTWELYLYKNESWDGGYVVKYINPYHTTGNVSVTWSGENADLPSGTTTTEQMIADQTTIDGGIITTGYISADRIAAGSITADKIATDAIKSRNYISSGGTQGSFLNLSDGSFTSPNLSWDSNGNLIAKNANISGQITATIGSIGGWNIGDTSLFTGITKSNVRIYDAVNADNAQNMYQKEQHSLILANTYINSFNSSLNSSDNYWHAQSVTINDGEFQVGETLYNPNLVNSDKDEVYYDRGLTRVFGGYITMSRDCSINSDSRSLYADIILNGEELYICTNRNILFSPLRTSIFTTEDPSKYNAIETTGDVVVSGKIKASNELQTTASQMRIISGSIGCMLRNDSADFYILRTNAGDPYGDWTNDRPFRINWATNDITCGHNLTANDLIANSWLYCSEVHSSGAVVIGADSESFYWAHGFQIARGTSWGGVCIGDDGQQLRLYGSSIWASHGISTSDENLKENFTTLDQYEDFYMNLNPIGFNYIGDYDGKKTHFGFGAHKTEDVLESEGYDADEFAVVTHRPLVQEDLEKRFGKDVEVDIETEYGVSYTEFIALNTHMIQKTRRELTKVKQEKADLEVRLQAIEAKLGL